MQSNSSKKPWILDHIIPTALIMAAIVGGIHPLILSHFGLPLLPFWFWAVVVVFNFFLFVACFQFMRVLHRKREEWSSTTNRWFGAVMLVVAVALIALAFYVRSR